MSSKSSSKEVVPTTAALNNAIRAVLDSNENATWKDVSAAIKKEQPNWKLQERRVAKFVKRQKLGDPISDEQSVRSMGSRLFSSKRSKKSGLAASSVTSAASSKATTEQLVAAEKSVQQEQDSVLASTTVDTAEASVPTEVQTPPTVEEAQKIVEQAATESGLYKDDNDGKIFKCSWCL